MIETWWQLLLVIMVSCCGAMLLLEAAADLIKSVRVEKESGFELDKTARIVPKENK